MKKRSHAAPKRDEVLGSYPGGKSGAGIYQRLINLIPPHELFISPFAGHCGVARNIKPSRTMTLFDRDPPPPKKLAVATFCDGSSRTSRHVGCAQFH